MSEPHTNQFGAGLMRDGEALAEPLRGREGRVAIRMVCEPSPVVATWSCDTLVLGAFSTGAHLQTLALS